MKCVCTERGSYERLADGIFDYSEISENSKDNTSEKEENIDFYHDTGTFHTVLVENKICAIDLCRILHRRFNEKPSGAWTIQEYLIKDGLERTLEDHEYVLSAYKDLQGYPNFRMVFRQDFSRYEFFQLADNEKGSYFEDDMLTLNRKEDVAIENFLIRRDPIPLFSIPCWYFVEELTKWVKSWAVLRDKELYIFDKEKFHTKYDHAISTSKIKQNRIPGAKSLLQLDDYQIYTTINAQNQQKAPFSYGVCLRPHKKKSNSTGLGRDPLKYIVFETARQRAIFLTVMRLAKYGKQLRENYRAYKNRQTEAARQYQSYSVANESLRSRVAMDFTGSVGRVVEDPLEAMAIEAAEGHVWKKRWRRPTRGTGPDKAVVQQDVGIHTTLPWFHSSMSRDQANTILNKCSDFDGVFLVRGSQTSPGMYVLSYRVNGKVRHNQIGVVSDKCTSSYLYTMDEGRTRFYDLLQLVEFHQLNPGILATRLTHYVSRSLDSNGTLSVTSMS